MVWELSNIAALGAVAHLGASGYVTTAGVLSLC